MRPALASLVNWATSPNRRLKLFDDKALLALHRAQFGIVEVPWETQTVHDTIRPPHRLEPP